MKLSDKTITSLVKGALDIQHIHGMLGFCRYPRDIIKRLGARWENFGIRASASAGIRLDFISDTNFLKLGYLLRPGSSQELGAFDILVDGKLWASEGENVVDGTPRVIETSFNEGKKHITVYFPNLSETFITSLEISDNASVEPAPEKPLALFFGDSITQGYTAYLPSLCYVTRFAEKMGLDFYNFGIGGDVYNSTVTDVQTPRRPDYVFTAYGTNDWSGGVSVGALKKNMRDYYSTLLEKYPSSRIIAILPIWRDDCSKVTETGSFDELFAIMKSILSEFPKVEIIDGRELVPHVIPLYADLRLHPNDLGFEFYAQALFDKMSK